VKIPILLDFVQPDNAMTIDKEATPSRNVTIPRILGTRKVLSVTLTGNPVVVIIKIFVIANTVTRKQPEATVATFRMLFVRRLLDSLTIKLAVTAIEKPPNNELMVTN